MIDEAAVRLLPSSDVFVLGMGWLFSLHGFTFFVFCGLGAWTGSYEIYRSLDNAPITITAHELGPATTGRNVKILGAIEADKQIVGQRKHTADPFTLTLLRDSGNAVVIYTPGLLPDEALKRPRERWYEGELIRLDGIEDRIDGKRIPVRSMFLNLGIDLPKGAFVVADSVIPTFRWWYVLVMGMCVSGLVYIIYRLLWTVVFLGNRDALFRHLSRR